jgi:serine phosphatase RsbU (regulator of sigma subunit)
MPADSLISRLLPECFILNIPKDIVSGDFFWLTEKDDKVIFTVADCTGHGVPGAFMSLLAITFLNEIVNHQAVTRSDVIVNVLRERVIDALQSRNDNFISDGLDLTLCVLDRKKKIIEYSGGMSDFVFIHNGDLKIVKTDRISVCSYNGYPGPFTMNEIGYERGDVIYLYSDGYQDQFGGEFDKKFLPLHFQVTLREIHRLPMHKQKEFLEKRLEDWRKGNVQTDDITVLGIRL